MGILGVPETSEQQMEVGGHNSHQMAAWVPGGQTKPKIGLEAPARQKGLNSKLPLGLGQQWGWVG